MAPAMLLSSLLLRLAKQVAISRLLWAHFPLPWNAYSPDTHKLLSLILLDSLCKSPLLREAFLTTLHETVRLARHHALAV